MYAIVGHLSIGGGFTKGQSNLPFDFLKHLQFILLLNCDEQNKYNTFHSYSGSQKIWMSEKLRIKYIELLIYWTLFWI